MKVSRLVAVAALLFVSHAVDAIAAERQYGPGVTDTDIKIGQTVPYSGPASAFSSYGRVMTGYFQMLNEKGGINGRKVNLISLDNAFSPPKAIEQTRKLVDDDGVLAEVGTVGTVPNVAVQKYLNQKKVPQVFISAGGRRFNDPQNFPWTVPFYPPFEMEGATFGKFILKNMPNAKIAVLYQNDDYGKDYLTGLKTGLGSDSTAKIVAEVSYELSYPTVDSEVLKLKASGADTLIYFTTPKFAAQAIKRLGEVDWHPLHILTSVSASVGAVMQPAGFENSQGILSAAYLKDGADPQWDGDDGMKKFVAFLAKYYPDGNKLDGSVVYGYAIAQTMVKVLEMCGDNLARENVMRQAANMKDFKPDTLLPGISINTSPGDFAPITQLQMMRFKGEKWDLFGDIISSDLSN